MKVTGIITQQRPGISTLRGQGYFHFAKVFHWIGGGALLKGRPSCKY